MIKKLKYNKQGLGFTEIAWVALYHPVIFTAVKILIDHDVKILPFLRKII